MLELNVIEESLQNSRNPFQHFAYLMLIGKSNSPSLKWIEEKRSLCDFLWPQYMQALKYLLQFPVLFAVFIDKYI